MLIINIIVQITRHHELKTYKHKYILMYITGNETIFTDLTSYISFVVNLDYETCKGRKRRFV